MMLIPLAVAMAVGTATLGWGTVPALAFAYGVWRGPGRPAAVACVSALLGWGVLMLWNATQGPMAELSVALGSIMGVPSWALIVATGVFPSLLAWSAAVVGSAIRRA